MLRAALLAVAGAAISSWLLWRLRDFGFFGHLVISDVGIYQKYGDEIVRGLLPYRDFELEYPPGAIPAFILPALLGAAPGDIDAYVRGFEFLMIAFTALAVGCAAIALWAVGATRQRAALALAAIAISPLVIGPMIFSHYDPWPTALTSVAIAAFVAGRGRLGSVALAASIVAKVYSVVLFPLAIALVYRRSGRREALACAAITGVVVLLVVLPFAVLSPDGIANALERQINRPLQVESLGASLLFLAHGLFGLPVTIVSNFGSQNLSGSLADALAFLETLVLGIALIGTWVWYARGTGDRNEFLRASAVTIAAYIAFGKVLSPQYLIWLAPVVPLVAGRRGLIATAVFFVACFLTQYYFPSHYFDLIDHQDGGVALTIFLRDVALASLFVVLAVPASFGTSLARLEQPVRSRLEALTRIQPETALAVVLLVSLAVRVLWLWLPAGSLIFDEAYYVNAARAILGWHIDAGASYAGSPIGLDPNTEHPPLGKVLIAGSMLIFGDNGLGWRIPSVAAGMIALVAVYLIVRNAGETGWLGVLAVTIYSLDTLSFIHGRIGTLDMIAVAFMLIGAAFALRRRWVVAAISLGLATVDKETAILGLLAVLILMGLDMWSEHRRGQAFEWRQLRPAAELLGTFAVASLGILWLLDLRFTTYTNPIEHVIHMLSYGAGLTGGPSPSGIASNPWDWLVNGGQFDYLRVAVNDIGPDGQILASRPTIVFHALMNPVLVGTLALSIPTAAFLAWRGGHRLATWALVWMAANYLPFVYLGGIAHRISYLYYILPTIPAFAVVAALLLARTSLPRLATWSFLAASVATFVAYFPFRQVP